MFRLERRAFLLTLTCGVVALAMVVGPVIADELFGVITKVDVDGKKLTVVEKGTDKEIIVTTTDDTEVNGLGVRTASPMNMTLTKHHKALAARKRSSGVRSI